MRHSARSLRLGVFTTSALIVLAALPASAQSRVRMDGGSSDSASFVVPRRAPASAEPAISTRDQRVALVLRDTVVIMQLTDTGMARLFDGDTATRGSGAALFARMARASISVLMDHGIAYRISALSSARAEGSRLVLEDRAGKHVFEDTSYNGHHPMTDFSPADAARFASAVQRAIDARR